MKTIQHFVGGKSFSGQSKRISKVFNPATGEQSAEVKLASTKDVNDAISNAQKAFVSWSDKPPLQRARVMFKFKERGFGTDVPRLVVFGWPTPRRWTPSG